MRNAIVQPSSLSPSSPLSGGAPCPRSLCGPRAAALLVLALLTPIQSALGSPLAPASEVGQAALPEETAVPPALRRFAFVENLGQWSTPAAFVAVRGTTVLQALEGGFHVDTLPTGREEAVRLGFRFDGARPDVQPVGDSPLPGLRNYVKGNDPERWVLGARSFEQLVYEGLYEGIDLRLRGADGMPEYDLLLAPGADLAQVVVRCEGVRAIEVDERGGLSMHAGDRVLRQTPPLTWCVRPSGEREPVPCEFVVHDATSFGFRLAPHDSDLPVVIDPGLEWATYLGGSALDVILQMDRTSLGEIVVVGGTRSPDFLGVHAVAGAVDGFVAKLDPTGSTLLHSTLLGGSSSDFGLDLVVDSGDEIYVLGATNSADFPTTPNAFQPTHQGSYDGYLAQLDASLAPVLVSYLGGTGWDIAGALSVHAHGILTIAGATLSTSFPFVTADAVQATNAGGDSDYFLCRLDLAQLPANPLQYGTYLGGTGKDGVPTGADIPLHDPQLHTTASGVVTLVGRTTSTDIVRSANSYDATFNSIQATAEDGYVARIDPSIAGAAGLVYDSYLGGSERDAARALDVDSAGVITVGGFTDSPDFPTTPGAIGSTFLSIHDAWIARLDPSLPPGGGQLLYGTLLAGEGGENLTDLVLDSNGRIVAQGYTGDSSLTENSFPVTCGAFQTTYGGQKDSFLLYIDPAGNGPSDLLYSTYLGGSAWDIRTFGLEILSESPTLKVLSAGGSGAFGFPAPESWGFDSTPNGVEDGLLIRLEINPHTYCVAAPNSYGPDGAIVCGSGSVSLSDNDFHVSVEGAVPSKPGLFYFGPSAGQAPFGDGFRCVTGSIKRLNPASFSDATGSVSRWVDFSTSPGDVLAPGSAWYFQYWYRDPAGGGSGFNLSNGLRVVFYP